MKRHRQGLDYGIPLRNLCVQDVKAFPPRMSVQSAQSFRPFISNNRLYLKRETRITVPHGHARNMDRNVQENSQLGNDAPQARQSLRDISFRVSSAKRAGRNEHIFPNPLDNPDAITFALCLHLRARIDRLRGHSVIVELPATTTRLLQLHERMQCVLTHPRAQKTSECEKCRQAPAQCPVCKAEYQIAREGKDTLVVTAQYDFGRAIHPFDSAWKRHLQHSTSTYFSGGESAGIEYFKGRQKLQVESRLLTQALLSEGSTSTTVSIPRKIRQYMLNPRHFQDPE